PRRIVTRRPNLSPIEINNIEVSAKQQLDPDIFAIPKNTVEFETCEAMEYPKAVYQPEPHYSAQARQNHTHGFVGLNLIVTKDGHVSAVQLLTPTGDGLDRNAVEAAMTWRFTPGSCEGHPVNVPLYVEFEFSLR